MIVRTLYHSLLGYSDEFAITLLVYYVNRTGGYRIIVALNNVHYDNNIWVIVVNVRGTKEIH